MASKRTRQDEIKDIGGFVGGYLAGGKRTVSSVIHRQLLTLDIDHAKAGAEIWETFSMLYSCAAAVYSTHKHSAEAPRLRLVIPLDRPVLADEYVAIARRIAGNLDIENFDNTGFQPSRLMYWPSTSKDGVFQFNYQDGPWLIANDVLATYRDWKDSSEWPVSDRVSTHIATGIKKQGDPLEKPGVVGAFCKTFTIAQAIEEFLGDTYEPCAIEDRYTYKEGSTAAGLVVYDDKYAFSHHGTDPISGKLCNAFDLVRLHKFGLKDEDAREGTPGNKLPSYTEMIGLATKVPAVRKQLGAERLAEALSDFGVTTNGSIVTKEDDTVITEPVNNDWLGKLDADRKGNYYSTIDNMVLIIENDPVLKNTIAYDEFEQRAIAERDLPWRKVTHETRYLTDRDDDNLSHYLEKAYNISSPKMEKALNVVYERHRFHPVRDYLKKLQWDGRERVETLFIDYLGAEDSEYTRAVTRKMLAAAVTRVFRPGCKMDYSLITVGAQGQKKSELINRLGRQWFSDSFTTVQGKEAYEQLQGVWLVEIAELSGFRKAEVETIKHFISKKVDRFRVAYGRRLENFPRQCVFFGTSNKRDFLKDPTGNRRFWPVPTHVTAPVKKVFDLTDFDIDQIWAEAVQLYHNGEPLYLEPELERVAFEMQADHSEKDDREGIISNYLEKLLPADWDEKDIYERREFLRDDADNILPEGTVKRTRVCVAEIWCEVMGGHLKEMTRLNTNDLHNIMRKMKGWHEYKTKALFPIYGVQKSYFRDGEEDQKISSINLKNKNSKPIADDPGSAIFDCLN
jgi:putative DNA primase/helicase